MGKIYILEDDKNISEIEQFALKNAGYEVKDDAALADVALINTCGFIDSAKSEAIDNILQMAALKVGGRQKNNRLARKGAETVRNAGEEQVVKD